ncbi:FAD/FMN-containing dehydrogenase [Herbaspirillum sp. 1173]|jgi:4-phosphoerythronate dehydrogenase (FAD-dependent)|uniref:FAD-binding oxidoreductase n=1 Tax=unclassified Herbaspirillum TaxID=2624150 RepID=UPI0010664122|nr:MULTISPECIES: FAD-binding oxidoreductase [unclassified Herbaspirillum]MBP1315820.1 FAD/FMN-containing dehydrogenase [Herbaspirillum sp. 1130]MDR6740619.1 FAD/FMN-containing dehydrogenase [Herbaspirillum sp. 1173]
MNENTQQLIEQLRSIVGDAGLVTAADEQAPYVKDWLNKWQGRVAVVVRPADTAQTAEVVRLCHQTHTPIVTQGGNTGMSGGATPDDSGAQVILSTTRMNRIRAVDPINNTMTVDAGVILAHAQEAARAAGRYFPLSLGAEGSCTVGGNLATNAGGIAVLRFGNMRELALGLEVVLPDGRIWNGLRGLRKDNTGYDLRDLFIGSEGTLGVITGAVLKLFSQPHARATAWVGCDSLAQLAELLARTRARCGDRLVAFEMMSAASLALVLQHVTDTRAPLAQPARYNALIELADTEDLGLQSMLEELLGQAMEDALVTDAMLCSNGTQAAALWKIREGISQAQVRAGKVIKHDIALPISAIAGFVDQAERAIAACGLQAEIINFGHLGDGNLHFNVMIPLTSSYEEVRQATLQLNRLVHDLVTEKQGSISAEHGVGQLRRDELRHYKSPLEMELMLRIKQAFDPNLIMNPGKLL